MLFHLVYNNKATSYELEEYSIQYNNIIWLSIIQLYVHIDDAST